MTCPAGRCSSASKAASGARLAAPAAAQTNAAPAPFGYQDVVRRAQDLAAAPFDSLDPAAARRPSANLDFDGWRDIRFKSGQAAARPGGRQFPASRVFHLGHLFKRPVTVNVLRDGIRGRSPTPPTCSTTSTPEGRQHPADQSRFRWPSFCAFRSNAPHVWDEVIAFLGTSYFRFPRPRPALRPFGAGSRDRRCSLALNEDSLCFASSGSRRRTRWPSNIVIYALLALGESATGAFRFDLNARPGNLHRRERVSVRAQRRRRRSALRRCSSMYFVGKADRRFS